MKRILVLLLCMMLLFSGCTKVDDSADTTLSTTESTIPAEPTAPAETTEPTAPPTTEPATEPVEINSEWLTEPVEYLSYEEFFSRERTLTRIGSIPWQTSENSKYYDVYFDENGLFVKQSGSDRSRKGQLHSVPDTEWVKESANVTHLPTDGRYVYCIRNENEIVRVELLTGEQESLYSGGEIMGGFAACKEGVLYFAAREQEAVILYRLYIPERKLDVLYDQIPGDIPNAPWFLLMAPDTNWSAIGWKMMNPEMVRYVNEEFENPDSQYIGEDWWTEDIRDWRKHNDLTEAILIDGILTDLGEKYNIPYRLVCRYDYRDDVYTQREEYAKRLW